MRDIEVPTDIPTEFELADPAADIKGLGGERAQGEGGGRETKEGGEGGSQEGRNSTVYREGSFC